MKTFHKILYGKGIEFIHSNQMFEREFFVEATKPSDFSTEPIKSSDELIKNLNPTMKCKLEFSPTPIEPYRIKVIIGNTHVGNVPIRIAKKISFITAHVDVLSWEIVEEKVRIKIKSLYL